MIEISRLRPDNTRFRAVLERNSDPDPEITATVAAIVADVRARGDAALFEYMKKFDGVDLAAGGPRIPQAEIDRARDEVPPEFNEAVALACDNLRRYHEHQRPSDYEVPGPDGELLERRYRAVASAGVCVPSGTAPLCSTLYMNLVPALVAGVERIAVITAPRSGAVDPHIRAVASHLGVSELYAISGAQGVAALAYGTESVPRVDKITGPGSVWVTTAKRLVSGAVGIDSLAGPSEIVVFADADANPTWVAIDLLSQAEHGTGDEAAIAFVSSERAAEAIRSEVERLASEYALADAVRPALERYGNVFVVDELEEAVPYVEQLAPEHVELMCAEADSLAQMLRCHGALFIGEHTPESVGDYFAGTNHVLPTGGTARFASGLTVADFMRSSSVIRYTREALAKNAKHIVAIARPEKMDAHRLAVELRVCDEW